MGARSSEKFQSVLGQALANPIDKLFTEKDPNRLLIGRRYERRLAQIPLALLRFRCHYMRLVRLFTLQVAAGRELEALFRARLCLHLRHRSNRTIGAPLKLSAR